MHTRRVLACLALALTLVGMAAAAQRASGGSVLAIDWRWPHRALVRADPVTFDSVGTERVVLGRFTARPTVSPDGRLLVAGAVTGPPALRVVDLRGFRALGNVRLAAEGTIDEVEWLDGRRVAVVVRDDRGTTVFVVDPRARTSPRSLRFRAMDVSAFRRDRAGLVALGSPISRIGHARLLVFGPGDSVRSVVLARIPKGRQVRNGRPRRVIDPGLAVDRASGRAFVVARNGTVAEVALGDLTVRYHDVRRSASTAALAKDVSGWQLQARFERGTLVVGGYDTSRKHGFAAAGLRLIDTRTWRWKTLDPEASSFLFVEGLVLADSGRGMTAYRLDGGQIWRLEEGEQWSGARSLTQPYLYVDRMDEKIDVVSIRTGEVVRTIRSRAQPADPRSRHLVATYAILYGMRTTLDLDDDLFDALLARHPGVSKTEAVERAIRDYLAHDGTRRLRDLKGKVEIEDVSNELRRDRTA